MKSAGIESTDLTEAQFRQIATLVKDLVGIDLHQGKQQLVRARLAKRLRQLGIPTFKQYLDYLRGEGGGDELTAMLDALSTNKTSFFREPGHFDYLVGTLVPRFSARRQGDRRLRIWSAGCSSGEEPYSIAMHLLEAARDLARWEISILATDLSTRVLARARNGVYETRLLTDVPRLMLSRYFTRVASGPESLHQVVPSVRQMVQFARLNLIGDWPMRGPFDIIFCRNVMIYFDEPTRTRLVKRFWELLAPQGTLFIGHSESLTRVGHEFTYIQPTVYEKPMSSGEGRAA